MHAVDTYPHDAVIGGCFVTGRFQTDPGERVLDLDIDMDSLTTYGRLCVSERAVVAMVKTLGWEILTPERGAEHEATLEALSDACEQLDELMEAMTGMVNLPAVERALDIAARKIAGKESIQEWVDTLPKAAKR